MNTSIKTGSRTLLAFSTATLLAASALMTAGAHAEDYPVRVETVQFQDLNVNTPAGAQALYDRIYAAANRVCEWSSSGDPFAAVRTSKCARKAAAKAVEQLKLPALTAYYNLRTGAKASTLIAKR